MSAAELLAELHRRGIELQAAGDRLRWRPREALTDPEYLALADHKAELLVLLNQKGSTLPGSALERDARCPICTDPRHRLGWRFAPGVEGVRCATCHPPAQLVQEWIWEPDAAGINALVQLAESPALPFGILAPSDHGEAGQTIGGNRNGMGSRTVLHEVEKTERPGGT
jgi:hypothetical protein